MRRALWLSTLALSLVAAVLAGRWTGAQEVRRQIEVTYREIQIRVDGRVVASDAESFIVVDSGRTMVPARPLAEALGGTVVWDGATNSVNVYTQNYVESTVNGSLVTYRMPALGLQVVVPARLKRTNLLGTVLSFASTTEGAVVQRLTFPPQRLDSIAEAVLTGMRSMLGDLEVTERQPMDWSGGKALATRAVVPGSEAELRLRVLQKGNDIWAVSVLGPRSAGPAVWEELDAIFAGFLLH